MPDSRFPPVELPDTPVARELQRFCLSFEGAWEDYPWGDVVYKVGSKIFCFLGFLGGNSGLAGVTVKATQDDADALCHLPHIDRARYIGRHGWVSVSIEDEGVLGQAFDLIDASYQLVRGRRSSR
jgi:predicted DNA-binding protein (MmcQ/YjbR family)